MARPKKIEVQEEVSEPVVSVPSRPNSDMQEVLDRANGTYKKK